MEIYGQRTRCSSVYSLHTGGIIKEAYRHSSTGGWGEGSSAEDFGKPCSKVRLCLHYYEHLSDMWLSTLDFVTEIAPDYWTVLTECENRIPIRYGFRPGAIAIRNSMNTSIRYVTLHLRLRHRNLARLLNNSYVRTEFLSAIVFVPAQKIAIRYNVNTYPIGDSPL